MMRCTLYTREDIDAHFTRSGFPLALNLAQAYAGASSPADVAAFRASALGAQACGCIRREHVGFICAAHVAEYASR
jgi:hypothetical protein